MCPYGKHQHPTKHHAKEHLVSLIRQRSTTSNPIYSHQFDIYKCRSSICNSWHIGHKPKPRPQPHTAFDHEGRGTSPPPPTVSQRRRGRTRHKHPYNPRKARRGRGGHNLNKKRRGPESE